MLRELASAIGTLEHEEKEKQLEALVRRIEEMLGCLRDYRIWLQEKGIDATNMRAMGSAEGTMHMFAKRSEAKTVEVGRTQGLKRCYERSSR